MAARTVDRLLGIILLAVSALWCWAVITTIPSVEDGSRLGARGFPMGLGVLLGVFGTILLARTFVGHAPVDEDADVGEPTTRPLSEMRAVLATVGLLVFYAVALQYTGFLIATFVTVAVAIGPVLGLWRPRLLFGMALGLSLGIYLVFGKLLGVYLPYGTLFNLAF